jgi:hypothetical protein
MSKAPQAPDPAQVAQQQQQSNLQSATQQMKLNAPLGNVSNAYGSNTVQIDPKTGLPTGQTSTLSAPLQGLLNQREGLGSTIGGLQSQLTGLLPLGGVNQNFGDTVGKAANAAYGAQTGLLAPTWQMQTKQLEQQLDDRGLPIGSEARKDAENQLRNSQSLAQTQAANNAYGAGLQAQNQGFNQAVTNQSLPYQQLAQLGAANPTSSLLGLAPGAANLQPSSVANTNVGQIYQNSYEDALKAQQANSSALTSGLFGLGKLGLTAATGGLGGLSFLA